jgi:hypothetical protein
MFSLSTYYSSISISRKKKERERKERGETTQTSYKFIKL